MIFRGYQSEAIDATFEVWKEQPNTLVVLPTGLGKTVVFSGVIKRLFPRRVMVVAHREELIFQAADKIKAVTGMRPEIEMGEYHASMGGGLFGAAPRVVVASIQTLTAGGDGAGRLTKFDPMQYGALIIDEAHHATSPTYRRVIEWFTRNPALRVLGVTATPDRSDEEALGQVFGAVAYDYEITDAIHDGWLVPIACQAVDVAGLDYGGIRTTAGDLNGADLAQVLEKEEILHRMAGPTIDIIGSKRTLVFCASVAQAERLAEIFCRHRPGMAAWISGETEKEDRRRTLRDYADGRTQIICNCGVLTEGFDDWGVEVVVTKATKSRSLYAQQVGRGTRPQPGVVDGPETPEARRAAIAASRKPHCLLIDFVGNAGRHKLQGPADILGGQVSEEALMIAQRKMREGGRPVDVSEAIKEAQREVEEAKEREAAKRARLRIPAQYKTRTVDPFDVLDITPHEARGWDRGRELSDKQKGILLKQGIDPNGMPYTQAKQLLNEIFRRWDHNLCSYKQAQALARYGYDTKNLTREAASKLMDGLKANGWRKPAEVVA